MFTLIPTYSQAHDTGTARLGPGYEIEKRTDLKSSGLAAGGSHLCEARQSLDRRPVLHATADIRKAEQTLAKIEHKLARMRMRMV